MKIIHNDVENFSCKYPIERIAPIDKILFFDIETTGFTAKTSNLYLIGCVYYKEEKWQSVQFLAQNYTDEEEVLTNFFSFSEEYTHLIHFNGNNFDIPYINAKCEEHKLQYSCDKFKGVDIYKRIATYKSFLRLENCKQKTIESFLKIDRDDEMNGGDLIGLYHTYVKNQDPEIEKLLLLHNHDDIVGLSGVMSILAYSDMFTSKLTVTKVSANYFKDVNGNERSELLMTIDLPSEFPIPVSFLYDKCYFAGAAGQAILRVPFYEEELKYFYANYKDYYYLPDEDIALHKSVSSFVDKEHREQAKAANCYTRKFARFLPEWDAIVSPFFKRDYFSNEMFFELTDERRVDRDLFSKYASHVLAHMVI